MTKKIFNLFIFVMALGVVAYFLNTPSNKNESTGTFFPPLRPEAIQKIEIEFFTQGTRLERKNVEEWTVQNISTALQKKIADQKGGKVDPQSNLISTDTQSYPANPQMINPLIDTLLGLSKSSLISSNPAKQGLLEITDAALHVSLFDPSGQKIGGLYIGKQGPSPYTSYVRSEGSHDVYVVNQDLGTLVNKPFDDWKLSSP